MNREKENVNPDYETRRGPSGRDWPWARQLSEIWKRLNKNKLAMAGFIVLLIFIFAAIFADVIANYDGEALAQTADRLSGPSPEHWFGTDQLGRDVFARIVHGARLSLWLGFVTTALSLLLGGIFGAIAGYFGGWVDSVIMRVMDLLLSLPAILLALAIIAAMGTSVTNLVIAIVVANIPAFARIVRASVLTVVGQEYVEASRAIGMSSSRIILTNVIPNALGPIIVQATMAVAGMIIAAASLSFLGMGIQPPAPEWGAMLSEAKDYMRQYPYLIIFPGLAIVLSALSLNLFGDGLRDALDPKLKNVG
jgi:peptide/nickel transport system permease protein